MECDDTTFCEEVLTEATKNRTRQCEELHPWAVGKREEMPKNAHIVYNAISTQSETECGKILPDAAVSGQV